MYKLYKAYFPDEELQEMFVEEQIDVQQLANSRDIYQLEERYKDPFLRSGGFVFNSTDLENGENNVASKIVKQPPKPVHKPALKWPELVYGGSIAKLNSKNKKVILTIGEKEHLLQEGDIVNEVEVIGVYKDSIRLSYKTEEKTFPRKKS